MTHPSNGAPPNHTRNPGNSWQTLLRMPPAALRYRTARGLVAGVCADLGLDPARTYAVVLSVHEALVNACVHGSPSPHEDFVSVSHRVHEGWLEFSVTSRRTDWELPPARPGWPERGVGLGLIRQLADEVELLKHPEQCLLVLRWRLPT